VIVMTPSADPFGELAVHLARLLGVPAGAVRADLVADPGHLRLAVRQAPPRTTSMSVLTSSPSPGSPSSATPSMSTVTGTVRPE
jgi:hypothetical protein